MATHVHTSRYPGVSRYPSGTFLTPTREVTQRHERGEGRALVLSLSVAIASPVRAGTFRAVLAFGAALAISPAVAILLSQGDGRHALPTVVATGDSRRSAALLPAAAALPDQPTDMEAPGIP